MTERARTGLVSERSAPLRARRAPGSWIWRTNSSSDPHLERGSLPLRIVDRQGVLTRAEERRVYEMSARLSRYFNQITSVDWAFSRDGHDCLVTCKVHARSGFYRVEGITDSFSRAVDEALDRVVRQRRRRKAITETARRSASQSG